MSRTGPDRTTFTVAPVEGGWAVEQDGVYSDRCVTKDEAMAAANKRARAAHDDGRACQVRVTGEMGYFSA